MIPTGTPHELAGALEPGELLAAAAARVARRLDELYPPLAPGGVGRAEGYLRTLRTKLEEVLRGEDPEPRRDWVAANPLARPLLQALGQEILRGPMSGDAATPWLALLRAWMVVQAAPPGRAAEPPDRPSDDLPGGMRGPDAFELLVEVAHDFRSPLTSILFLAEALRDGHSGPVTDLQRSQLGLVYSAAFGLASIASDVMDLAREQKDLLDAEAEPFSLAELFATVERMVRPLVEEKGLDLRVVVPERWQSRGHPHALSRVLLNLTTNALKFTDDGTVEIGVHPVPHGQLEFYVKDTGRGISPERQKTIFQPFRRRSGEGREGRYFSSSGVGLSIARRLLLSMGSDLSVESTPGRGSRFSFVIPTSRG